MELRQLEYFVAVAEEANFTRAAERVHITQSGISAQIRQLEREVGARLFDRSTRVATLTVAGEAALVHARAALAAARATTEAVGEVTGLIRGRLKVGMVSGCTVTALFDALAAFHQAHPGVELSVSEGSSDELVARVREGRLDLALVGVPVAAPPDLESLTIVSEGLVALVPPDDPLAAVGSVTVDDLADRPLICMPHGTGIRTVLDLAFADRGRKALVAIQASAPSAIVDLARRGLGVAVLSASMAGVAPALTALPLAGADLPAVLALTWSHAQGPALRALVQRCEQAFDVQREAAVVA
ncbi:LysR family transcriptional regulator [Streptomyces radicis]|uniref:LysR family transcriptional regulator n=1 Tax=Streptomyces radicis TaxID=1750517 RepID=A0A3A9VYE1_9ACTN|nr:LysR family transcriptional regulator [Streptomyces radicis]RKN05978.1 LysR family transcriptional regulator [Streptomyces radicis]RKN17714.1 LysR family transcriptional regulator [Streptomyces radicis]